MNLFHRRRTRREELRRRADDLLGRISWSAMRWYGRQLRAEIPDRVVRGSAIAGGAGITAALANALRRRRRLPPAPARTT